MRSLIPVCSLEHVVACTWPSRLCPPPIARMPSRAAREAFDPRVHKRSVFSRPDAGKLRADRLRGRGPAYDSDALCDRQPSLSWRYMTQDFKYATDDRGQEDRRGGQERSGKILSSDQRRVSRPVRRLVDGESDGQKLGHAG